MISRCLGLWVKINLTAQTVHGLNKNCRGVAATEYPPSPSSCKLSPAGLVRTRGALPPDGICCPLARCRDERVAARHRQAPACASTRLKGRA
jgi:hypothetical protein